MKRKMLKERALKAFSQRFSAITRAQGSALTSSEFYAALDMWIAGYRAGRKGKK